MIVLDNIIFTLQPVGGISVCWAELIKRIEKNTVIAHEYIEYNNAFKNVLRKELMLVNRDERRYKSFDRYLPVNINKNQPFVFHSSYYRITNNKLAKQVITLHDFMYEKFDRGIRKKIHMLQKSYAMNKADIIVCISENTKQDLLYFYPQFKNKDIRIIYNGVGTSFMPIAKDDVDNCFRELNNIKYILSVGNRLGCKNFKFTIDSFLKLDKSFNLVLVGKSLSEEEKKMLEYEKNERRIYHYEGLSSYDLNILYNKAHCLLMPSLYEGFGIPILEAMKAGCPVVTNCVSSIPEVAGDSALYIENNNVESCVEQILQIENLTVRNSLREKGFVNAKRFSWDKNFDEYLSLYNSILK